MTCRSSSTSETAAMCFLWGFVSASPFFLTSMPRHTHTHTQTTHPLHPILFALFHLCRSLLHTLSLSLLLPALSLSLSLVRFRSLSLPLTLSLLSRAAESASRLCPNTDRLSNTNLRRKKIRRESVCM